MSDRRTPQPPPRRFVAVGDSLTEGKGDPYPDGRLRGFADLLAMALARAAGQGRGGLTYANLARPSVRVHEVLRDQVPAALDVEPDLITAVAGVNDVIALRFDPEAAADRLHRTMAALRRGAPAARIMTATMPDLAAHSAVARLWRGRVAALNAAVRDAALAHDVEVVDLAAAPPMARAELALDRVHPSPLGHLRVARAFAAPLGCAVPVPRHMAQPPRAAQLYRAYRTAAVAPRFVARRVARDALIAGQPPKRPDLLPL